MRIITLTLIGILLIAGYAIAEVPQLINYQGRLTDPAGDPVADGPYLIKFIIWDDPTATDPSNDLWNTGFQSVTVTGGLFNYLLGSNEPLPDDIFATGTNRYLAITVGTDAEISPRTELVTVPYAYHALRADEAGIATVAQDISCYHCVSTDDIDDGCITSDKIVPSAITSDKIDNGTIQFIDIGSNGAGEGEIIKMIGGNWTAASDESGAGGGDITAVYPGSGLAGGGTSGDVTLSVDTDGITSSHIATDAVTDTKIASGAVSTAKIATNAVTTTKIVDGTIDFNDIGQNGAASGQVMKWDGATWAAAADDAGAGGDITEVIAGSGLSGGGTTGDVTLDIASGGVTSAHLLDGAIVAADIDNTSVQERVTGAAGPGEYIKAINADGSVVAGVDQDSGGDITAVNTNAGSGLSGGGTSGDVNLSVTAEGITSSHIAANAVNSAEIADGSITAADIGTDAVGPSEILAGAVGTSEISDNSIVAADIATGGVGSAEVIDNSLTANDLATDAVGSSEINAGAVQSGEIMDGTILNADINISADISTSKIYGTAVNLSSTQTITGDKTFDGTVYFGDSTMVVNNTGIRIGDGVTPTSNHLVRTERRYNTGDSRHGYYGDLINLGTGVIYGNEQYVGYSALQGDGYLYGFRSLVGFLSGGTGAVFGFDADVDNNTGGSSGDRHGVRAAAGSSSNTSGTSYGVRASAFGGVGTSVRGIYAYAGGTAASKYAGYFNGNVHVMGTLSKTGGTFKIDHPLDPEHKYLQHSFVESPDMKNVYDGNVTLDANGTATITLPDYFEALNMDFRYQLTAIGAPAPNLHIAERIYGNQFTIAGGESFMEVSWQVTGIRNDKWAQANRIQVEVDKPATEIGTYLNPEEHGQPIEKHVKYEEIKVDLARAEGRGERHDETE